MDIAKQIEEIIAQRQKQAKNVEIVLKNWESLKQELKKIENERLKGIQGDSEGKANLSIRLQKVSFSELIEEVNQELSRLENLKRRLSRETLNIGVVGRMRQGKSTLLRSLTGLSDEEIPTSSEGVCTKVLSKIFHDPQKIGNIVEFHSWTSFQEIIHLYFDKLGLQGRKPDSLDDIHPDLLPFLPREKANDENAKHLYGVLSKEDYRNIKSYKDNINASSITISKTDIKKYTTRDDGKNNSEYLAVKELTINCKFPSEDVGKIGVIDLPGLGDNSISDVALLIKTLKQDIDFILFVRRPDPVASDWEDSDRELISCLDEFVKAHRGFGGNYGIFSILTHLL